MTHLQAEHHSQLQEFEDEIKKQRDRTVSMLAEKEGELEMLRSSSSQRLQSDYLMKYRYVSLSLHGKNNLFNNKLLV